MNLKDRIAAFDRDSKLLQEITSSYPQESEHHQALRRAASALWYVLRGGHDYQQDFGLPDRKSALASHKRPSDAEGDRRRDRSA